MSETNGPDEIPEEDSFPPEVINELAAMFRLDPGRLGEALLDAEDEHLCAQQIHQGVSRYEDNVPRLRPVLRALRTAGGEWEALPEHTRRDLLDYYGERDGDSILEDLTDMIARVSQYQKFFKRDRGRPRRSAERPEVSLVPLKEFAAALKSYWEVETDTPFGQRFDEPAEPGGQPVAASRAASFLLECARCVDYRYTPANCRTVMRDLQRGTGGALWSRKRRDPPA